MWDWLRKMLGQEHTPAQIQEAMLLRRAAEVNAVIRKADKTMEDARRELGRYQRELAIMTGQPYE